MKAFFGVMAACLYLWGSETLFVVERESSSLAKIGDLRIEGRIEAMHNMNHATVKFDGTDGYAISRDGYVVKFDPASGRKRAEYKTSQSAIGFVVAPRFVAVANYDNQTVDILDRDLKPLQTIVTGSKNVGIKTYKDLMIFALMDKDELWVLRDAGGGKGKPDFARVKVFSDVGAIPFDAMLKDNLYIVGFFNSPWLGVVDLDAMSYTKIPIAREENRPVLKVPHFGFWSVADTTIFVPSVGEAAVLAYDPAFHFVKRIATEGLPVFTALSPDKKLLAVTFSGKEFPVVQIIDTTTLEIARTLRFSGTVLHVRWSDASPLLYVSVNTADEVEAIDTRTWQMQASIPVKRPSGIFLYHQPKEHQ